MEGEGEAKRDEVRRRADVGCEDMSVVRWTVREKTFPMGEVSLANTRTTREKRKGKEEGIKGKKEEKDKEYMHTTAHYRKRHTHTVRIAQRSVDYGSTENTTRATTMITALFLSLSHTLTSFLPSFRFLLFFFC